MEVLGEARGRGVLLEENTLLDMRAGHVLCLPLEEDAGRGVAGDETREGGWLPCKDVFLQKNSLEGGENRGQETTRQATCKIPGEKREDSKALNKGYRD